MRVRVHLTIGEKETILDGECPIFDGHDYRKGVDGRLKGIGFWLEGWHYAGHGGPNNKGRVFVPWTSTLYVEELK